MVYRWRCPHCEFTMWTTDPRTDIEAVGSHLQTHHQNLLSKKDFWVGWNCPYCDQTRMSRNETQAVQQFHEHLFNHVEPQLDSEVHVMDEIDGTGNVMIQNGPQSANTDNARIHFLAPGDLVVFVTATPADRLRLLNNFSEWPAKTIVVTTNENPLEGVDTPDSTDRSIKVVQIDSSLSLTKLGETLVQVVREQHSVQNKISVEFDILTEIINKYDLQTVFEFIHLLINLFEMFDVIAHYYVDCSRASMPTINVLSELFDMVIQAPDNRLISDPN